MRMIKIAAAAIVAVLVAQWALHTSPEPAPPAVEAPQAPAPSGLVADSRPDPVVAAFERKATASRHGHRGAG